MKTMTKTSSYKLDIDVEIKQTENLYEVKLSSTQLPNIVSVMPARSVDEAMQVAMSSTAGFAQFLLSQKF